VIANPASGTAAVAGDGIVKGSFSSDFIIFHV
jgi:hypothetical protein